jgi:hypothetical protein
VLRRGNDTRKAAAVKVVSIPALVTERIIRGVRKGQGPGTPQKTTQPDTGFAGSIPVTGVYPAVLHTNESASPTSTLLSLMNRLALENEDTAPLQTRYTIWLRVGRQYAHVSNCCTLRVAIQHAQRMTPRGYITTHGERP